MCLCVVVPRSCVTCHDPGVMGTAVILNHHNCSVLMLVVNSGITVVLLSAIRQLFLLWFICRKVMNRTMLSYANFPSYVPVTRLLKGPELQFLILNLVCKHS